MTAVLPCVMQWSCRIRWAGEQPRHAARSGAELRHPGVLIAMDPAILLGKTQDDGDERFAV